MEYPFKDLLPRDEVLEREGYYRDWTHLDPNYFNSLTQISEYIKTKGFGVDVRLLIAQLAEHFSLKTTQINETERFFKDIMQELAKDKDFYSLPEIAGARRGYSTLSESLGNLSVDMINKNLGKLDQSFMTDEFLQQIAGNTPVNAVPADESVTNPKIANSAVSHEKTDFLTLGKNIFTGEYRNEYLHPNGALEGMNGSSDDSLFRTRIKPSTKYTISKTDSSAFRVALNNFQNLSDNFSRIIHNGTNVNELTFTSGANEDYLLIFVGSSKIPEFMQVEEGERSEWENYGHKLKTPATPYYDTGGDDGSGAYYGIKGDGITDDTNALKDYANHLRASGGGVLELPPNSTILFTETISIPSNVLVRGNMSTLKLGDDYVLEARDFRGTPTIYPYITTDTNSTDIHFENLTIVGNKNDFRNQRHTGLSFIDCERASAINVNVYEINYNIALAETYGTMGYNISTVRAKDVSIYGGTFDKGGYECVGVEQSQDVTIDNIRSGKGWRTSLQIHRNSQNIKVLNSTIRQATDTDDAGALTLHGQDDINEGLKNIQLIGNTISGNFSSEPRYEYNALIQIMDGGTAEDILVKDNILKGNRTGIYGAPTKNFSVIGNNLKIEKGNGIHVYSGSSNVLVDQNTVEVMDGIALSGSHELATLGTNIGF